jgi:hypothetical protein
MVQTFFGDREIESNRENILSSVNGIINCHFLKREFLCFC